MKIALFHHLPDGGAKIALYEQVKRLKENHRIDLFTFVEEKGEYDLKSLCERIFLYPYEAVRSKKRGVSRVLQDLRSFTILMRIHADIARTIDEGKYDVAFIHQSRLTQAPYLLRYLKTPSVYYCQEPLRMVYEYDLRLKEDVGPVKQAYEAVNRSIRKRIDRTNARSASLILSSSHYASKYITLSYGIHSQISPLGVDADFFHPSQGLKRKGMLFVAPRTAIKGKLLAEEALKMIPRKVRPWLTVIAPTSSGMFRYTQKQMVQSYVQAQATICTSILEPFGLVALESMACETPVIAVREGGYRETVVDGETGYLVERDPKKLAEKINLIRKSPDLAQKLGKAGRKHVMKNFSWEKGVAILEEKLLETAKGT
ncbi:glycosyltransferase family 4 protein [Patescibacteria group bacterium]|nr:glycosyltransferase family 4 protein [Patescibacteria group bacterium]